MFGGKKSYSSLCSDVYLCWWCSSRCYSNPSQLLKNSRREIFKIHQHKQMCRQLCVRNEGVASTQLSARRSQRLDLYHLLSIQPSLVYHIIFSHPHVVASVLAWPKRGSARQLCGMEVGHTAYTSYIQSSTNKNLLASVWPLLGNTSLNTEPLSFNEGNKRFS